MPPRPRAKLVYLSQAALRVAPGQLSLTARAERCVGRWATLGELLARPETELLAVRGLGTRTLAVIRRAVVEFVLEELMAPPTHRQWRALRSADDSLWEMEPQTRSLAEVSEEYLELLARYPLKKPRHRKRKPGPKPLPSLSQTVRAYFSPLEPRERKVLEMRLGPLAAGSGMSLGEIARAYDLSRERIRQIICRAEDKLRADAARDVRRPTVRLVTRAFHEPERPLTEAALDADLRRRLRRPWAETGPFLRSLLSLEPEFAPAGAGMWTWQGS